MNGFLNQLPSLAVWSAVSALLAVSSASVILDTIDLRALPDSPSGDYAPQIVDCPSTRPKVRLADSLSDQEEEWVLRRRNNTVDPLRDLLSRANIPGFDAGNYIDQAKGNNSALPNIAIAVSGGGYRALMNGAGFLSAADSRATASGPISGLLQSSTYLAGLSGGGWLVGSMFANNFTSVADLQRGSQGSNVWRFDRSIFKGPKDSGISILNTADYWTTIGDAIEGKAKHWNTSITDYWGRALSYQLVNASEGGPAYTFSSIAETPDFKDAETPFPIIVADGRAPGERVISLNATVFEFNPYEFGTWDPTTYGFAPIRYLASAFANGTIDSNGECIRGFDQIGFVMGTSSSLFNQFLLKNITAIGDQNDIPSFITDAVEDILKDLDKDNADIARYTPNPFSGWNPTRGNPSTEESQLFLVDGGEDGQNIPLHPLIQPARDVDIIFAVDSSANTDNNWPNGKALRATYDRVGTAIGNHTLFPSIPSAETFVNERLNQRPTLFGCDANNFTLSDGQHPPPLIFYIPNAPYTAQSNVSTFDMTHSIEERDAIIENGFNAATQGNSTLDEEWPVCVACAILSRSWWKAKAEVPTACKACFERYCWNGKSNETAVDNYDPKYIIAEKKGKESENNAARLGFDRTSTMIISLGVCALVASLL